LNAPSCQVSPLLPELGLFYLNKRAIKGVQTKLGNKACCILDLGVIAILGKVVVVAILHLSVIAVRLHLRVLAVELHLEFLGVVKAGVLPDDVRVVDLQFLLVDVAGEVVLAIPEILLSTEFRLGG